tara:strand:+ start:22615 stop:23244 length:630 start_codon:yes stop_codon:yes gene_type:complete
MYSRWGKRAFDLLVASILLVLLSPLILIVGVVVRVQLGGPVIFQQLRPGERGELFTIYKFRSMNSERGEDGELLPDEMRLGWFGRFLRSTSLDELPELWNVVRGEMSLVGPRPLLPRYLERYSPEQARRMEVRPGITGWAQVNGRNAVSWDSRFKMDVWYVDHLSFRLDVKVLLMTIVRVFRREGITAEGHATVGEFRGNGEPPSKDLE